MATVETVRGPVDVAELGPTLMHEHVVNITPEFARDYPHLSWPGDRGAILDEVVGKLTELRARGIETLVDATAFGHGRDVAFLGEVARRVDLNIVTSTGYYAKDEIGFTVLAPVLYREDTDHDVLVEMIVHDVEVGVAGTGVKAGVIKCASDQAGVTPIIERVLRACAVGHRATGIPITTHTAAHLRGGRDQQRIFADEGVDLSRVIIGHCGDSTDLDYLRELLDRGSTIGLDRFGLDLPGLPTLEQRIEVAATLCREGYADRLVLSHDITLYHDWWDRDAPPGVMGEVDEDQWVLTLISDTVLPALRENGVTDAQIEQMTVANPRRLLARGKAY